MANFGDVAINLPADWNRNKYVNNLKFILTTVGHTDGQADAYKTQQPDEQHQFYWCDFNNQDDISFAAMRGYQFCQKDEWSKNPYLWTWDANGYIAHGELRLMFRPASMYEQEKLERARAANLATEAVDAELLDAPNGLVPTDATGETRRLKRRARSL